MGVLKKGQSWTEPQFRSAEEIALEEQVKANKEKLKKKLQALQEEAFNSAYGLWKLELTKEQYTKIKDSLSSSYTNLSDGSKMLVTALKNHFRENVYKGQYMTNSTINLHCSYKNKITEFCWQNNELLLCLKVIKSIDTPG